MTAQYERTLQEEIMWRAKRLPIIVAPIPNGIWIPARTDEEKALVARIVARMKSDGMLVPGLPDCAVIWAGGGGFLELKRPATRDLFGVRSPAGRLSDLQKEFAARCRELGIYYAVCQTWSETREALVEWGAIAA